MTKTAPFFKNATLELYSYKQTINEYTEYGEPLEEYTLRDEIEVDIQPYSPESSLKEFGKILQDTYRVYLDKNVEIYDTDRLIIDNVKYVIIGSIQNWNHILPYKKIIIKRERKEI